MSEIKKRKHHKFTVAVHGKEHLGEHEVVAYGEQWRPAFTLTVLMIEHKLGLDAGSGVRSIREWPLEYHDLHESTAREIDAFLDFVRDELDWNDTDHLERYHKDINEHLIFLNGIHDYEKTAEIADLRLLGHVAAANEAALVI